MGARAVERRGRSRCRLTPAGAPLLIDALFGTGLTRGLEGSCRATPFRSVDEASLSVACDLPSGVETRSGANAEPAPGLRYDSHIRRAEAGASAVSGDAQMWAGGAGPYRDRCPCRVARDRGACASAARSRRSQIRPWAGACACGKDAGGDCAVGKARQYSGQATSGSAPRGRSTGLPASIVQLDTAEVNDERIGCLLVGPGMGDMPQALTLALTSNAPKVIDADGITHLGEPERLKGQDAIITPHEGEFVKLFGKIDGTKPERALEAARRAGR